MFFCLKTTENLGYSFYKRSWFLQEIRIRYNMAVDSDKKNNNVMTRIVDSVLEAMPDDFVIKEIIMIHKSEGTDMLYTIEDEPTMMAIHKEAIKNEGYKKGKTETRKEDMNTFIEILMENGLAKEEAIKKVEEKFKE